MRLFPILAVLIAATSAHAGSAPPAPAETRGVEAAFGNTVKAQYPDGRFQRLWIHRDGTWEAIGRRGFASSGHWTLKGDGRVCLKQSRPFPAPFKYCTDFPATGGVGAVWTSQDMSGEPIRLTLVPGIEKPRAGAGS